MHIYIYRYLQRKYLWMRFPSFWIPQNDLGVHGVPSRKTRPYIAHVDHVDLYICAVFLLTASQVFAVENGTRSCANVALRSAAPITRLPRALSCPENTAHTSPVGFSKTLCFTTRYEGMSGQKLHLLSNKIAFCLRFEQCRLVRLSSRSSRTT